MTRNKMLCSLSHRRRRRRRRCRCRRASPSLEEACDVLGAALHCVPTDNLRLFLDLLHVNIVQPFVDFYTVRDCALHLLLTTALVVEATRDISLLPRQVLVVRSLAAASLHVREK